MPSATEAVNVAHSYWPGAMSSATETVNNNNNIFYYNKTATYKWQNNKNTDGLVNKLASNLVTFESSPQSSMANRARKNSKIRKRTR